MNMHKAKGKGKEFDGVVLVEGAFKSGFFDERTEKPPFERSRRLLQVALTRARTLVTIIPPQNARPLVDWTLGRHSDGDHGHGKMDAGGRSAARSTWRAPNHRRRQGITFLPRPVNLKQLPARPPIGNCGPRVVRGL